MKSVRNVIVGREAADGFYNEVLLESKKNLRNSEEFVDYVRRPIVEWLAENNQAKL